MNEISQFDDELLSAYLDDELTPAERARLDERLAADPTARQLLDELRTVSRTMKELPSATLGADLRESVLRRAERAMLLSGERAPASGLDNVVRSFPIGRSKRAWFWAVSALAAGLLLMVFQQAPKNNRGLPGQVAQGARNELARDEALPPLEMKALEPALDDVAGVPLAATAESPPASDVADNSVADNSTVTRSMDLAASTRQSTVSASEVARPAGGGLGGQAGAAVVDANGEDLLVVHVSMKRAALENNVFDHLLEQNQIQLEASVVDKSTSSDPQDVEVVMVEAAPAQIYGCLADLNKDAANYVAIAVDDRLATSQRALAQQRPEADVMQFNRGNVQNQQQPALAPDNNYYYSTNRGRVAIDRKLGDENEAETQRFGDGELGYDVQGRAKRVAPLADAESDLRKSKVAGEKQESAANLSAANSPAPESRDFYSETQQNVARRAYQKLAEKADMLQVLFVLSYADEPGTAAATSEIPASSLPTSPGQPSSVQTEEGLKSDDR